MWRSWLECAKFTKILFSTELFVAHWRFIWHQGVLLLFFTEAAATIWGSWSPRVLKVIPPPDQYRTSARNVSILNNPSPAAVAPWSVTWYLRQFPLARDDRILIQRAREQPTLRPLPNIVRGLTRSVGFRNDRCTTPRSVKVCPGAGQRDSKWISSK